MWTHPDYTSFKINESMEKKWSKNYRGLTLSDVNKSWLLKQYHEIPTQQLVKKVSKIVYYYYVFRINLTNELKKKKINYLRKFLFFFLLNFASFGNEFYFFLLLAFLFSYFCVVACVFSPIHVFVTLLDLVLIAQEYL